MSVVAGMSVVMYGLVFLVLREEVRSGRDGITMTVV